MRSGLIRRFLAPAAAAALISGITAAQTADTVTFLYEDYPPYTYMKDGKMAGSIVDKTAAIAAAADIQLVWKQANFSRMLRTIANGEKGPPVCISGYGSSPERAATSWISKAFAMSSGSGIAVMRANLGKFEGHDSISEILTDPAISGAFLQGANYSKLQTPLIEAGRARHLFIGGDDNALAMMVVRGRVDFAMVNPDQVAHLKAELPGAADLVALTPHGMRPPQPEYILCTKSLPQAIRVRINAAIDELMPMPDTGAAERATDK